LTKHIESKGDGDADGFEERVALSGLELDEAVSTVEETCAQVMGLANIASNQAPNVDGKAMTEALTEVTKWVLEDVGGRHTYGASPRDARNWNVVQPTVFQADVTEPGEAVEEEEREILVFSDTVAVGEEDEGSETMKDCPEIYLHWAMTAMGGIKLVQGIFGQVGLHGLYSRATKDKETYDKVCEALQPIAPHEDCPDDWMSPFEVKRFGEFSGSEGEEWEGVQE